jgi:hypothetical protein
VFLGTPHGSSDREKLAASCLFVIKQYAEGGKLSNQRRLSLKEDSALWMIASRFDRINIRVEILSIFEQIATKKKTNFRWQKQSHLLV